MKFDGTGNFGLWQRCVKDLLVQQGMVIWDETRWLGVRNKALRLRVRVVPRYQRRQYCGWGHHGCGVL